MATKNEHIGALFKEKREERNITLKQAENATSIRINHLHAIEQGELDKIISPVYALGFIKQYAAFLELNCDELLKDHSTVLGDLPKQDFAYGIGTLEVRDNPGNGVKWLPNVIWLLAFFLLLGISWYLAVILDVI